MLTNEREGWKKNGRAFGSEREGFVLQSLRQAGGNLVFSGYR